MKIGICGGGPAGAEVARWAADLYLTCCTFHPDDWHITATGCGSRGF